MKPAWLFLIGAVLMALGVGTGAFGAHALNDSVAASDLEVFRTGVRYHLVHGLAILSTALLAAHGQDDMLRLAAIAFIAGIVLFSGSLYTLVLTGQRWLGAITPLGGVLFLIGWVCLAIGGYRILSS
jgi:uncharacterized membrane protein YgdD (TMEM256/DUF423 family)